MAAYPYTLADFVDAYAATGLTPYCGVELLRGFETGAPVCGCPQGVLAFHRAKALPSPKTFASGRALSDWAAITLGLSAEQYHQFALAYDYAYFCHDYRESEAYQIGRAARKRFMPHLTTDEPADQSLTETVILTP
jgi:hypothetical protein